MSFSRSNLAQRSHPAFSAACATLDRAGIAFADAGEHSIIVDGRFLFWPVTNFWRSKDGASQGYNIRNLINKVQENGSTASVLAFPDAPGRNG